MWVCLCHEVAMRGCPSLRRQEPVERDMKMEGYFGSDSAQINFECLSFSNSPIYSLAFLPAGSRKRTAVQCGTSLESCLPSYFIF